MAKEVVKKIKLQIEAGKATPAPPVGTVLGPAGINLGEFCTKYNDATRDRMGDVLPVEISIYDDRSFAEIKLPDLNCYSVEEAMKIVEGTARNMGIAVEGLNQANEEAADTASAMDQSDVETESVAEENNEEKEN